VFVARHLGVGERFLAAYQWNLQGVSQMLESQPVRQLGASVPLWDALLATVEMRLVARARG